MKKIMTAVLLSVIALLMSASAHGQAMLTAPEKTIEWTVTQEAKGENVSIIFTKLTSTSFNIHPNSL